MRRTLLLLLAVGLVGCRRGDDGAASQPASSPTAELDRLRALPYAGYVDVEPDLEQDGVAICQREQCSPGYTLYVVHRQCLAELIELDGRVVRRWQHQPSKVWTYGELLPDGRFVVVGADHSDLPRAKIADEARYLICFDWDGQVRWKRRLPAHHDVTRTPDGQLLALTLSRRRVPAVHPRVPLRDEQLALLTADGQLVESISLYDLLSSQPERFPLRPVGPSESGGEPWIELFHCNSVQWIDQPQLAGSHPIYETGNILVCFRHQDRVAVINWPRRELVWSWGLGELSGPHDARLLPSGNLLIFDNGLSRRGSRVIELDPRSGQIVWQYRARRPGSFYSPSKGSSQRLPNGNTLIADSDSGRLIEVTAAGKIVWEFRCRYRNRRGQRATLVFAERFSPEFVRQIEAGQAAGGGASAP